MKNVSGFWDWVLIRMDEVGIKSITDLESRSGFSKGAIVRRKNDYKFPTVEMAEGMCHALRVTWVELWDRAGFVQEFSQKNVALTVDRLDETEAAIYYAIRGEDEAFKQAVLKTVKAWLAYKE